MITLRTKICGAAGGALVGAQIGGGLSGALLGACAGWSAVDSMAAFEEVRRLQEKIEKIKKFRGVVTRRRK